MSELGESNISIVNDVFIKQIHFRDVGYITKSHIHCHDHQTLLANGKIKVTIEGLEEPEIYTAPSILFVKAGLVHAFESLEPNTVLYCIHAIKGGETVDEAEPLVVGIENNALAGLV